MIGKTHKNSRKIAQPGNRFRQNVQEHLAPVQEETDRDAGSLKAENGQDVAWMEEDEKENIAPDYKRRKTGQAASASGQQVALPQPRLKQEQALMPIPEYIVPVSVLPQNTRVDELIEQIHYSQRYYDDVYEYRHVILPKTLLQYVPSTHRGRLLMEHEWRAIGIQQSVGWEHYMLHAPEPHIFAFRREKYFTEKYMNPPMQEEPEPEPESKSEYEDSEDGNKNQGPSKREALMPLYMSDSDPEDQRRAGRSEEDRYENSSDEESSGERAKDYLDSSEEESSDEPEDDAGYQEVERRINGYLGLTRGRGEAVQPRNVPTLLPPPEVKRASLPVPASTKAASKPAKSGASKSAVAEPVPVDSTANVSNKRRRSARLSKGEPSQLPAGQKKR